MSKQIITISREFGSGGRSVGKRVAELLDVPYYDKKLVEQVAVETGFDEKFIEQEGEYASPWQSLLSYAFPGARLRHPVNGGLSTADFLWVIQCRVILDLVKRAVRAGGPLRRLHPAGPGGRAQRVHPRPHPLPGGPGGAAVRRVRPVPRKAPGGEGQAPPRLL